MTSVHNYWPTTGKPCDITPLKGCGTSMHGLISSWWCHKSHQDCRHIYSIPTSKTIQVVKNSFQVVYNSGSKAYNYANHTL